MRDRSHRALPFLFALAAGFLALILGVAPVVVSQEKPAGPDLGQASLGKSLFRGYCGSCHGESGRGDGPIAEYLKVEPRDLTRLSKGGAFPYDDVVQLIDGRKKARTHGSADMPVWGEAFQKAESGGGEAAAVKKIHALAHYVWSIQIDEATNR